MTSLDALLGADPPPFALLYRPESTGPRAIEVLTGPVSAVPSIDDLPDDGKVLAILPYRQIADRGFSCHDDSAELLAMRVRSSSTVAFSRAIDEIPDVVPDIADERFDIADDAYARIVESVIGQEIGRGEGSNFVIKRSLLATIANFTPRVACALFRRLLLQESGAYWTFLVHTGALTLLGASPERHVSLCNGKTTMNPISGTYRYPPSGPDKAGLLEFLHDTKEADELYMVLDEELKMMAAICETGGRVIGPRLKEMAHLAHTEYFIEGQTDLDARQVLKRTMFAPTVTGSPLANACRAIQRHEPRGRGYYGGAIALITQDRHEGHSLDSAILIRTAQIDRDGRLNAGVGATLVRHSQPAHEVAETKAKAAGLWRALSTQETPAPASMIEWAGDPEVLAALRSKNRTLASFWLGGGGEAPDPSIAGSRVLIVDAEDAFTEMLAHQIRRLGPKVEISRFDETFSPEAFDLVILGPGPGDPRDLTHPKIVAIHRLATELLHAGKPLLAVCLGHQILSGILGLRLVRKAVPNQGLQREIDLFGKPVTVGFYNTFTAISGTDTIRPAIQGHHPVQVAREQLTGEVHALRGRDLWSIQFHAESVLSTHGLAVIHDALTTLLTARSGA